MVDLLEHEAGVMNKGPAGGRQADAAPPTLEQSCSAEVLHLVNALAGGGERDVGHRGSTRDARRFSNVKEKFEIN
jgi:hypothetical protein